MTDAGDLRFDDEAGSHGGDAVNERAELLPEEVAAGSDDPLGQAAAILEESEERTQTPEAEIRRAAGETADPQV